MSLPFYCHSEGDDYETTTTTTTTVHVPRSHYEFSSDAARHSHVLRAHVVRRRPNELRRGVSLRTLCFDVIFNTTRDGRAFLLSVLFDCRCPRSFSRCENSGQKTRKQTRRDRRAHTFVDRNVIYLFMGRYCTFTTKRKRERCCDFLRLLYYVLFAFVNLNPKRQCSLNNFHAECSLITRNASREYYIKQNTIDVAQTIVAIV